MPSIPQSAKEAFARLLALSSRQFDPFKIASNEDFDQLAALGATSNVDALRRVTTALRTQLQSRFRLSEQ